MMIFAAIGVWTASLWGWKLHSLDIAWGEQRECYHMQSNRIVGIMSDYRVRTNWFCVSQYRCEVGKECAIEFDYIVVWIESIDDLGVHDARAWVHSE